MKTLVAFAFALLALTASWAQEVCPRPDERFAVFFGNGILTAPEGATRSLDTLADAVGNTVSGYPVRYDLAYNFSDGAFLDLLQSLDQTLAQFTSQTMLWLQGRGMVPGWFSDLISRLLQTEYQINAPELQDHVRKYREAIGHGQKVQVVSHSQGNLYVNQAKQLLQALPGVDMRAFGIFAVATPASNVGGAAGPYYTNDRDIIAFVPGSFPSNWSLRDAAGALVSGRDRVAAHSFVDTYMSADYNMRDALVFGVKAGLVALQDPPPVCDNYRKHFIGLLAGAYVGHCNAMPSPSAVAIDRNAQVTFPNGVVDLSGPNVAVGYVSRHVINTSNFGDNRGVALLADVVGGGWALDGRFKQLGRGGDTPMVCEPRATDAATFLGAPPDIGRKAAALLEGYRDGFTARQCRLSSKPTGLEQTLPAWQPVSVANGVLSIGDYRYDLTGARVSEFVAIAAATSFSPPDYEPQFVLDLILAEGGHLFISYKSLKGLETFVYDAPDYLFSCGR